MFATAVASCTAAWAQSPSAVAKLPIGSPLTIVSDDSIDPRVHPGSEFRAHLRDPLTLGATLVATAGTSARIVVTAKDTAKDGTPTYRIAIVGLNLGLAGTLPVRPDTPVVERLAAGTAIPASTLAAVEFDGGKVRVVLPLPFTLSNEPPYSGYTPAPLRTANPIVNNRNNRRRPTPAPSTSAPSSPGPSPGPSASATTGATSAPSTGLTPAPAPT